MATHTKTPLPHTKDKSTVFKLHWSGRQQSDETPTHDKENVFVFLRGLNFLETKLPCYRDLQSFPFNKRTACHFTVRTGNTKQTDLSERGEKNTETNLPPCLYGQRHFITDIFQATYKMYRGELHAATNSPKLKLVYVQRLSFPTEHF